MAASTDAVKLWRYDAPKEGPITFDVTIGFAPETEPRVVAQPVAAVAVVLEPVVIDGQGVSYLLTTTVVFTQN